ncbi:hypothetical protein Goarm_015004, partial [Gossypium armourianum]|nr:hypothetical protein [Gossypium armourianum]
MAAVEPLTSGASGRINALFSLRALRSLLLLLNAVVLFLLLPFRGQRRASAICSGEKEAAARRLLAIQRVVEDDDNDTVREFSLFTSARGETLFTQSWTPVSVVVSGRYSDFAKRLNANGFKVYGMDWI